MIALLWAALISTAFVAAAAFGLVLVLARRLRTLTERVDLFLPMSAGSLPDPGTPVPEFATVGADGTTVTHADLAGDDRLLAFLSTDCASCKDQVPALAALDPDRWRRPVVVVVGEADQRRRDMVAALDGHALVVTEDGEGTVRQAFEIQEYPAVLLIRESHVSTAAHGLAKVLETAEQSTQQPATA
jgi:AhpC/TSA family